MTIRDAKKEDLLQVQKLNKAAKPHVTAVDSSQLNWFLKNAALFLVAESNKEIAGFMIVLSPGLKYESLNYRFFEAHFQEFLYVDRIVVADGHRREGLGRQFYETLFEEAKSKRVTCEVNLEPPNPDSYAFHRSMGFHQMAEQWTQQGKKKVAFMVKD